MAELSIHGMRGSTCTRRVLATAEETGAPYKFVLVDCMKGEHKQPDYLAKNQPFGKVPFINHGDLHVYESWAITRYIAETFDKTGTFYPKDPKVRAIAEQWISVLQSYYPAEKIVYELYFGKMHGASPNQENLKKADTELKSTLVILDKHFAKNKYLVGDIFTYADVCYYPYTEYMLTKCEGYSNVFDEYPNVKRWWSDISNRPSWKKVSSESEF
eukprot:TRINITY_DN2202_c0_g1_i1.p1 TRINITY_DN2202_c0_g1~~TRINITY_DN2202_c0_g1_i1.p1  ORF type:complete len:215 (-),score=41.13 TRINITY_DN2202_c0_g1_i1:79-723(-)